MWEIAQLKNDDMLQFFVLVLCSKQEKFLMVVQFALIKLLYNRDMCMSPVNISSYYHLDTKKEFCLLFSKTTIGLKCS